MLATGTNNLNWIGIFFSSLSKNCTFIHFQSYSYLAEEHFVEADGIELVEVVAYLHTAFGTDYKHFEVAVGIEEDVEDD